MLLVSTQQRPSCVAPRGMQAHQGRGEAPAASARAMESSLRLDQTHHLDPMMGLPERSALKRFPRSCGLNVAGGAQGAERRLNYSVCSFCPDCSSRDIDLYPVDPRSGFFVAV